MEGELDRRLERQETVAKETTAGDYYEILQISPRADQEIVERAYRILAKRYHPDNSHSGDAGKFGSLTEAYQVLSDPERRAAYDNDHRADRLFPGPLFNTPPSGGLDTEKKVYRTLLSILYVARRRDVMKAGVGIVHLEKLVGLPSREVEFHLWYLKEKGWIQRLETGEFAITVSGVDTVIENNLILREDRLLPTAQGFPLEPGELKELTPSVKSIPGNGSGHLSN